MPPPSYTRPMRDRCSQCHCEQRSDEAISFFPTPAPSVVEGRQSRSISAGARARIPAPFGPACLGPRCPRASHPFRPYVPRISSFARSFPSPRGRGVRGEGALDPHYPCIPDEQKRSTACTGSTPSLPSHVQSTFMPAPRNRSSLFSFCIHHVEPGTTAPASRAPQTRILFPLSPSCPSCFMLFNPQSSFSNLKS
jgi:hypothetical protein